MAAAQGAVTGATGVWGAAIDIPASFVLALRTIYQTGRSHGFDLTDEVDQDVVAFVFKEIDLGLVAEKQTLLLALKALKSMLETHDLQQFQQLLGSNNDIELVKQWLVDDQGQFKWGWLNRIPQVSMVGKLTPIAGAALGGFYSWKLLEDVGHKSQSIFGAARFYLNEHPNEQISALEAYFKAEALLRKEPSKYLNQADNTGLKTDDLKNDVITHVAVQLKHDVLPEQNDDKVSDGLQQLAEQYVEEHEHTKQQSALKSEEVEEFVAETQESTTEQQTIDIEPASTKHS